MEPQSDSPGYAPAKIQELDLERPVTRNQRVMPDHEIKRIHGERLNLERSWGLWDERTKRRLKLYPIGAVLTLPFVFKFVLMPIPFSFWHLPLFALYGAYLAVVRPMPGHATAATFALALIMYFTAGRTYFTAFTIFYCVLGVLVLGYMIGVTEESKLGT